MPDIDLGLTARRMNELIADVSDDALDTTDAE